MSFEDQKAYYECNCEGKKNVANKMQNVKWKKQ